MRRGIVVLSILLPFITHGQDFAPGTFYRQNKAGDYAVAKTVTLTPQMTFQYRFSAHMIEDTADGVYSVSKDNTVTLTFDTTKLRDQNYLSMVSAAPTKFMYRNDRLYELSETGRPIRSARLIHRHRRFYLFGDYSRRRKVFLKRVESGRASR